MPWSQNECLNWNQWEIYKGGKTFRSLMVLCSVQQNFRTVTGQWQKSRQVSRSDRDPVDADSERSLVRSCLSAGRPQTTDRRRGQKKSNALENLSPFHRISILHYPPPIPRPTLDNEIHNDRSLVNKAMPFQFSQASAYISAQTFTMYPTHP